MECGALSLGKWLPALQRIVVPSSSTLIGILDGIIILHDEGKMVL
jgi:hypothetical protein